MPYINARTNEYPFTIADFRRSKPNVSFPKYISEDTLRRNGIHPVYQVDDPSYDKSNQKIVQAETPSRETNGAYTEENAPDQMMVGEPIYTGRWILAKTVVDLTSEEQTEWDATVAEENRETRNRLLADTDHYGLSDVTMTAEMITYRQTLRDLPETATSWPHLSDDDWPTKP